MSNIIKIKVDMDTFPNFITFLAILSLEDNDPRKKILGPEYISKETIREHLKELIKLNRNNKTFIDSIIQI